MKILFLLTFFIFVLFLTSIYAEDQTMVGLLPINDQGRFRPLEVYSKLHLKEDDTKVALTEMIRRHFEDQLPLLMLPSRRPHHWLDLSSANLKPSRSLFLAKDATLLHQLLSEWTQNPTIEGGAAFSKAYFAAYTSLTKGTAVNFPSLDQLRVETWYYAWPMINVAIISYLMALFCLLWGEGWENSWLLRSGIYISCLAWLLHTAILIARAYILWRPPVANMAETMLYVPWIGMIIAGLLSRRFHTAFPMVAATGMAAILLSILEWTLGSQSLDTVQAVLNSQFWLMVHVLMIVGSYGILILAGLLGHIVLFKLLFLKMCESRLTKALLQSLYLGVALLIPGTILGGVWAAQSWGRFWDWDPKEAWAFISACVYLLIIHAYRFRLFNTLGLALGSIAGLITISFTWYGVNYILGTGLHSYGFGSGGEWLYYIFISTEILIIISSGIYLKNSACIL